MLTKLKLVFDVTEEVDEMEELSFAQMLETEGYLAFSGDPIKLAVEEAMKNTKLGIDEKGRSKSKVLRGVIYKYWAEHYTGKLEDEDYYMMAMDKFINMVKAKIKEKESLPPEPLG